jgi:predicted DNA-binding protein
MQFALFGTMEIYVLNVRIPLNEREILESYCKANGRNKTDVVREFIRSLADKANTPG